VVPDGFYTDLTVTPETASTNADVVAAARAGAAEGLVVTAERQAAGRGRLGRGWSMPSRAGIAVSVLFRPDAVSGWFPLLVGVAAVEAVRRVAEVDAVLKWPNDVLVGGRKLGGILVEMHDGAVVAGVGLNVSLREDELPVPTATSLVLAGAEHADRDPLLRSLLRRLADWYGRLRDAGGDPVASGLRETYLVHCATIGREVRLDLPGNRSVTGTADDIDPDGRIVVDGMPYAAADVVHLR
jgi:BirA family biotin operon repressor/biotin-[acetyl-CoA-carboxylase] ligase